MDFSLLTNVGGYCFPAFIYAMFVVYIIIFTLVADIKSPDGKLTHVSTKDRIMFALLEMIWGVIILYALLLLCKRGLESYAWAVLLLPPVLHLIFK